MYNSSDEKKSMLLNISHKYIKNNDIIRLPINPIIDNKNRLVIDVKITIYNTKQPNNIKKLYICTTFNDIDDLNDNINLCHIDIRKLFYIIDKRNVHFSLEICGLFSFGNVLIYGNELYYLNNVFKPFNTIYKPAIIENSVIMSYIINVEISEQILMYYHKYITYDSHNEYDLDVLYDNHKYAIIYQIHHCSNELIIMFYNHIGNNTSLKTVRDKLFRITGNDIYLSKYWNNILNYHSNNIYIYTKH